jgi:outer membrane receptor protein involved in Fe transport
LGLITLAARPAVADAQTAPPGGGGATDQAAAGPLQEVLVTATRHEEPLSRVPISVTAITQADIDAKGIKDIQDIVRFTPGVSIDTAGTNSISIRGISSSAGADTTGIYIDDTPIQMRSVGFNPDDTLPKTFDIDRVEVLRGPQGTLFGAGSEGGTVRYIMNQPSLTTSSTYMRSEVSYTEYGEPNYEVGLAHGGPIVDGTLGWRASAWYRYDGGWINRVDPTTGAQTEANANHGETAMLRLAGIWAPVASVQITPSIIYQDIKRHDQSTFWPAYSNPSQGEFNTATPERIPVSDEWYLPALKINWDLGKSQIISDTSYFHRKELTGYQGTVYDLGFFQLLGWPSNPLSGGLGCLANTPANCSWYPLMDGNGIHLPAGFSNFQTPNVMTNNQETITQELRWQSSDASSRWRWTVGLFWQQAKEGSLEQLSDPNNQLDGPDGLFNYMYGETASDFFGPYFSCPDNSAYPAIPACNIYYNKTNTVDKQIAGFAEVTYAFSDQWRLTVGERIAHTTFDITNYSDGLENFGPLGPRSGSTSDNPSTPKVTLAFQANPQNMFYAGYAKGFRRASGWAAAIRRCRPTAIPTWRTTAIRTARRSPTGPIRRRTTRSARRTPSATTSASRPVSTTSSGRTSSRASTSPAAAGCSSSTTSAQRSPRGSICRRKRCLARCTWILRPATPARASPATPRSSTPAANRSWPTVMRSRGRLPSTERPAPARHGRSRSAPNTASIRLIMKRSCASTGSMRVRTPGWRRSRIHVPRNTWQARYPSRTATHRPASLRSVPGCISATGC